MADTVKSLPKFTYVPGMVMPTPEPDAPAKLPSTDHRNVADIFKHMFPEIDLDQFKKDHGIDPELGRNSKHSKKKHPYESHEKYQQAVAVSKKEQEANDVKLMEFYEKWPEAYKCIKLTGQRTKHEKSLDPKEVEKKAQRKAAEALKKQRLQDEANSKFAMSSCRYFPDPVQRELYTMEYNTTQEDSAMVADVLARVNEAVKRKAVFRQDFMNNTHKFYAGLNLPANDASLTFVMPPPAEKKARVSEESED